MRERSLSIAVASLVAWSVGRAPSWEGWWERRTLTHMQMSWEMNQWAYAHSLFPMSTRKSTSWLVRNMMCGEVKCLCSEWASLLVCMFVVSCLMVHVKVKFREGIFQTFSPSLPPYIPPFSPSLSLASWEYLPPRRWPSWARGWWSRLESRSGPLWRCLPPLWLLGPYLFQNSCPALCECFHQFFHLISSTPGPIFTYSLFTVSLNGYMSLLSLLYSTQWTVSCLS